MRREFLQSAARVSNSQAYAGTQRTQRMRLAMALYSFITL